MLKRILNDFVRSKWIQLKKYIFIHSMIKILDVVHKIELKQSHSNDQYSIQNEKNKISKDVYINNHHFDTKFQAVVMLTWLEPGMKRNFRIFLLERMKSKYSILHYIILK